MPCSRDPPRGPPSVGCVQAVAYVGGSILSIVLLGVAACCGGAAKGNHLSRWWVPAYASLLMAFVLVAQSTLPGLAAS